MSQNVNSSIVKLVYSWLYILFTLKYTHVKQYNLYSQSKLNCHTVYILSSICMYNCLNWSAFIQFTCVKRYTILYKPHLNCFDCFSSQIITILLPSSYIKLDIQVCLHLSTYIKYYIHFCNKIKSGKRIWYI